jgi:hypothetical protein
MNDDLKILPGQVTQLTNELSGSWTKCSVSGVRTRALILPPTSPVVPSGSCQVCGERPATEVVHGCPGAMTFQCRRCILRSMVSSAREAASKLPDLERELSGQDNSCTWKIDEMGFVLGESGCGVLTSVGGSEFGTPFRFCPYCGRLIFRIQLAEEETR